MRRKTIFVVLVVLLLTLCVVLAACGSGTGTTTTAAPSTTGSTEPSTATSSTASSTGSSTETSAQPTTTAAAATGEPIKVGVMLSLTGVASAPCAEVKKGIDLAVEQFNAAGGASGRPVALTVLDDKTDVSAATAGMTKLIEQDKVTTVLGPFPQWAQEPARAIAEKAGMPNVAYGPPNLNVAGKTDYHWSFVVSNGSSDQADAYIKEAQAEGWKNIVGIGDNLSTDQEPFALMKDKMAAAGITLTVMSDSWSVQDTDVTPIINKIFAKYKSVKPDALFILSNPLHMPVIYKTLRSMGVTVPIASPPTSAHPAVLALGPAAVDGLIMIAPGCANGDGLPADYPGADLMKAFAAAYKAKYNAAATFFSGYGYDSMNVLLSGIKAGGDDKAKIRDAIAALSNVQTCEGVLSFTPWPKTGAGVTGGYAEWKITNGQITFVRPLN